MNGITRRLPALTTHVRLTGHGERASGLGDQDTSFERQPCSRSCIIGGNIQPTMLTVSSLSDALNILRVIRDSFAQSGRVTQVLAKQYLEKLQDQYTEITEPNGDPA